MPDSIGELPDGQAELMAERFDGVRILNHWVHLPGRGREGNLLRSGRGSGKTANLRRRQRWRTQPKEFCDMN